MKKFNILMLGALAIMASACEKEIEDALPQVNPQEPVMTSGDVTCAAEGPLADAITNPGFVLHLQDYNNEDNSLIPIVETTEALNLPAGAKVTYTLQLADNAAFDNYVVIDAMGDLSAERPDLNYVTAAEWNDAHIKFFGKNPDKEQTMYFRVPVYVTLDGTNFRYESVNYYAMQGEIHEYCMESDFNIEESYYFLSNATTWSLNDAAALEQYPFTRNNPDVSVYDDPVFTITVQADENCYWKIAPKSTVGTDNWDQVYGSEINGDTAEEGTLVLNGQSPMFPSAGRFKVTINMENLKYTVQKLEHPEYIYTPGGANNWNQTNSAWMQWNQNDENFYGIVPVSGGMKFCALPAWNDPTNFGGTTDAPGLSGTLVQGLGGAGSNINVPTDGVYWTKVGYDKNSDLLTTYEFMEITRIGLIGSFAASNWGDDIEMTKVAGKENDVDYVDYVTTVTWNEGDKYKVRFNSNWDYALGGAADAMSSTGGDITVEKSGTFKVTLHLLGGVPRITLEEQ